MPIRVAVPCTILLCLMNPVGVIQAAVKLENNCPCGPVTQVRKFRSQEDLALQAATAEEDYIRSTASASSFFSGKKDREFQVFNWTLFSFELKTGWIPVLGQVVAKASEEAKQKFQNDARAVAIRTVKAGLDRRPDLTILTYAEKRALVVKALEAAENQHSFTPADAFQNEAINTLLSAVDGINTRVEMLAEYEKLTDKTGPSSDISEHIALAAAIEQLKSGRPREGVGSGNSDSPAVVSAREHLLQAAGASDIAASQFAAAGNIATRLGSPQLGATLSKGGEIASFASSALQAAAGNPLAYLPALSTGMNLFGGGGGGDLSWIAGMLQALSKQIEEVSVQIQENHQQVMERLNYVAFLGEMSNEGIRALLSKGIDACDYIVPEHWRDEERFSFLDYSKPLVFASYDELARRPIGARWGQCRQALLDNFARGRISAPLEVGLSREGPTKESADQAIKIYRTAQKLYPPGSDLRYLYVPARWTEDFRESTYTTYADEMLRLAGRNTWDPLSPQTPLLDPIATELWGGYALALHGVFDVTDGPKLLDFGQISNDVSGQVQVPVDMLEIALGHVNLAIAQQQMLTGVIVKLNDAATRQEISLYFRDVPFAQTQFGAIAFSQSLKGPIQRNSYRVIIERRNVNWLNAIAASIHVLDTSPTKVRIDGGPGLERPIVTYVSPSKASFELELPAANAATVPMAVPQLDATIRLAKLQARLAMAIKAYTTPSSSDRTLKAFESASLIGSIAVSDRRHQSKGGGE